MYSDDLWVQRRTDDLQAEAAAFRLARKARRIERRQRRQRDPDATR